MSAKVEHGFSIRWGDKTISASGFESREAMEAARAAEFASMRELGWTPPRWWQLSRRRDTRP